jgi:phosphoadenylyl-sulfate reductase (thioredoxin)
VSTTILSRDELKQFAQELEGRPAGEILRRAGERLGKVTFASGFGMEGCVIIDLIARQSLPIDVFTMDTGLLFPETYELWRQLESHYGITIRAVRPEHTVDEQTLREGPQLWGSNPDRCCDLRKVQPLRSALASFDAWVSAIRRDQSPDRADAPVVGWDGKFGLPKVNPLVQWTFDDVRAYIQEHAVPHNVLHDLGYPSIGCWPCTTPVAPGEDPRAGRWRGREKTECGLHLRPPQ